MTSDVPDAGDHASTEADELLFPHLDEYMHALQTGDRNRCREILEEFPDVAKYVDCLGVLDDFAAGQKTIHSPRVGRKLAEIGQGSSNFSSSVLGPNVRFGKFLIQEEIGRGGMGIVFRATHTDLQREVAIKVIRSQEFADKDEMRRFQVEARAAARINHPHVVSIHEIGEIEGLHYLAMEFIRGETLATRLKRGPMELEAAVELVATIADAVDYLHKQSVLHRDLKPSNILIDESGKPFVADFGLARIFGDDSHPTKSNAIIGTPSYMSPEQASARSNLIGPPTDVYGLGVLLYEMLTGAPPFKEENPLDTIVQVIEAEPQLPSRLRKGLDKSLERICLKCIEKEPEKRYATAALLAEDLRCYLRGEEVTASSPKWYERLRRWTRRYPATASRLAGVASAAIILQSRFFFFGESLAYHIQVMTILGVWMLLIGMSQLLTRNKAVEPYLEYTWVTMDAAMMTTMMYITTGELGPLVIGYPLVVVASGMFFNVRVVTWSTICSCIGYLILLQIHPDEPAEPVYAIIYIFLLALLGAVTAYQVHRVKVLSRFYEKR